MDLIGTIREEIMRSPRQAIPFSRYMELALYHPRWGYYSTERQKVGKEGDFYTSAAVHPVFAETLADVVATMCEEAGLKRPVLVEIGGGTGAMCRFLLNRLRESRADLYARMGVMMIETSPYHRKLQQERLAGHDVEKVWYSSLAEAAEGGHIEGVILSNEWLDAFPVHIARKEKQGWQELWVTWEADGFAEQFGELTEELAKEIERWGEEVPRGVRIEVNTGMEQAARDLARLLKKGFVVTIDYGDLQEELYHPSRKDGTLMCFYRHQAERNPYDNVGKQDMTAHVNFTAWMRHTERAGFSTCAYMRQDQFLIRNGLLQKAVAHADRDPFTSQAMKRNRAIVQLVDPAGLGGRFRVLIQSRDVPPDAAFFVSNGTT